MARLWQDLTVEDFRELDPEKAVAILPVAAVESHGPHLPLGVDSDLCLGILQKSLPDLPDDVLILPLQSVGRSPEHRNFPGTLSLSAATLISLWYEIGVSVAKSGIKKLLILNGHGGQMSVLDIVVRDLRTEQNIFCCGCSLSALGRIPDLFPADETRYGFHGGASETSQMMALYPQKIRTDRLKNFHSAAQNISGDFILLEPEGAKLRFGWMTEDLNPEGALGNALLANREAGEKLLTLRAAGLTLLVQEMIRFPLKNLHLTP